MRETGKAEAETVETVDVVYKVEVVERVEHIFTVQKPEEQGVNVRVSVSFFRLQYILVISVFIVIYD